MTVILGVEQCLVFSSSMLAVSGTSLCRFVVGASQTLVSHAVAVNTILLCNTYNHDTPASCESAIVGRRCSNAVAEKPAKDGFSVSMKIILMEHFGQLVHYVRVILSVQKSLRPSTSSSCVNGFMCIARKCVLQVSLHPLY